MTRDELRGELISEFSGHNLVLGAQAVVDDTMPYIDAYVAAEREQLAVKCEKRADSEAREVSATDVDAPYVMGQVDAFREVALFIRAGGES